MVATLVRRAYSGARTLLALIGVVSVAGLLLLAVQKDGMQRLPALASEAFFVPSTEVAGPIQASVETPLEREQRVVTEYIAKRYRIADAAAAHFVSIAYRAAEQHRLDALLVLAVMAIESRYNPVAESVMGAKGLMQVIPKYHQEKLFDHGGEHALLEPEVNIQVGAQILREYQRRFRDLETALQMYGGALDDPATSYALKVLAEKARLDALKVKAKKQTAQSA